MSSSRFSRIEISIETVGPDDGSDVGLVMMEQVKGLRMEPSLDLSAAPSSSPTVAQSGPTVDVVDIDDGENVGTDDGAAVGLDDGATLKVNRQDCTYMYYIVVKAISSE